MCHYFSPIWLTNLCPLSNFYWIPCFCACECLYKRGAVHIKSLTLMDFFIWSKSENIWSLLSLKKFTLCKVLQLASCSMVLHMRIFVQRGFNRLRISVTYNVTHVSSNRFDYVERADSPWSEMGFSEKYNFWQKFWGKYWSLKPLLCGYSFSLVSH